MKHSLVTLVYVHVSNLIEHLHVYILVVLPLKVSNLLRGTLIFSFILDICIVPLQENYSEMLPTLAQLRRAVLR